jgi:hypothetical protein
MSHPIGRESFGLGRWVAGELRIGKHRILNVFGKISRGLFAKEMPLLRQKFSQKIAVVPHLGATSVEQHDVEPCFLPEHVSEDVVAHFRGFSRFVVQVESGDHGPADDGVFHAQVGAAR